MTVRALTDGEIALAKSVFGSSIDYSQVRVEQNNLIPFQGSNYFITPSNTVHLTDPSPAYSNDYSTSPVLLQGFFIHELTHALQFQEGMPIVALSIPLQFKTLTGISNEYKYGILTSDTNFKDDLNIEQQADVMRNYFYLKTGNDQYAVNATPLSVYLDIIPFLTTVNAPLPPPRPTDLTPSEHCFPAGTLIQVSDGSSRPIEAIRPGDMVLAFELR